MRALIVLLILDLAAIALIKKRRLPTDGAAALVFVALLALVLLCLAAMCGLLLPAAAVLLAAAAAAFVLAFCREQHPLQALGAALRGYCSPGVALAHGASLVYGICYTIADVRIYYWDEFAFWGRAAKVVKCSNALYHTGLAGDLLPSDYPPGAPVLNYLFSFFSGEYSEVILYLSYAILTFAVMGAAAQAAARRAGKRGGVLVFCTFMLLPYLCSYHLPSRDMLSANYAYGTTMPDTLLAVVALAAVVLFLAFDDGGYGCLWAMPALAYVPLLKETGLYFALLALCVIGVLGYTAHSAPALGCCRPWVLRGGQLVLGAVACLGGYGCWGMYVQATALPSAAGEGVSGAYVGSMLTDLLMPARWSPQLREVMAEMARGFTQDTTLTFAPDWLLCSLLLGAMLLGALLLAQQARTRVRLVLVGLGVLAGGFVYALALAHSIANLMHAGMVEYGRYMSSFYLFYFWVAVLLLACSAQRRLALGHGALSVLALATVYLFAAAGPVHTMAAGPQNPWARTQQMQADTRVYTAQMEPGSHAYLLLDPSEYSNYQYHMYPDVLACVPRNADTGWDFTTPFADDAAYHEKYQVLPLQEYRQLICDNFDYVLIRHITPGFAESYGSLFAGGLEAGVLYSIDAAASACFIPMEVAQ